MDLQAAVENGKSAKTVTMPWVVIPKDGREIAIIDAESLRTLIEHAERSDALLAVVAKLEADPHSFGTQNCSTCRQITETLCRPFGCCNYPGSMYQQMYQQMYQRKEGGDVSS